LTYSGWLTHISGHPSATSRAQDSESTPAKDRCSTAGLRHQPQPPCTRVHGPCLRTVPIGARNTLPVFTARERGSSLRAVFTARDHGKCVPNLTLPPAESISPAIGKFGLKMPIHARQCRQACTGMYFPPKSCPFACSVGAIWTQI